MEPRSDSASAPLPSLHLSRPAIVIPDVMLDNDAMLSRVRESVRGPASDWDPIERAVRYVFDRCNTKERYVEPDPTKAATRSGFHLAG